MQIKVMARHIRMSPKKIRLVINLIKGLEVEKALNQLKFINKRASVPLIKLINSAIANAEHNHEIKNDNLYIEKFVVDEGQALARWTPRAFGRATPIRKRSSHITLILAEKVPSLKKKTIQKEKKEDDLVKIADYKSVPKGNVPEIKGEEVSVPDSQVDNADVQEKKAAPFDKALLGKHRHPEGLVKKEKGQQKGKGFIKKLFKRKAV